MSDLLNEVEKLRSALKYLVFVCIDIEGKGMVNDTERKKKIAQALTTRPMYLEIKKIEWTSPQDCIVSVSFRGFGYVVKMRNDNVVEMSRTVVFQ